MRPVRLFREQFWFYVKNSFSLLRSYLCIVVVVPLIFITITALHFAYPYVASEKFSGTKRDQDAESFLPLIEAATLWNKIKTNFITRFSEGRFKFGHQLEVEPCWPDDMEKGIPNARQNAERATQKNNKSKGTWNIICDDLNQSIYG